MIGGVIMTHGDDDGLRVPPQIAPHQIVILPMLREHGIGVSIDDFGVGYSSLSMLAEITADELKVDRSFITGIHAKPRSQTILKVIELLGNALNLRIVVEGVDVLVGLNCSPITVIGVGGGSCSANVVCCEDNSYVSPSCFHLHE